MSFKRKASLKQREDTDTESKQVVIADDTNEKTQHIIVTTSGHISLTNDGVLHTNDDRSCTGKVTDISVETQNIEDLQKITEPNELLSDKGRRQSPRKVVTVVNAQDGKQIIQLRKVANENVQTSPEKRTPYKTGVKNVLKLENSKDRSKTPVAISGSEHDTIVLTTSKDKTDTVIQVKMVPASEIGTEDQETPKKGKGSPKVQKPKRVSIITTRRQAAALKAEKETPQITITGNGKDQEMVEIQNRAVAKQLGKEVIEKPGNTPKRIGRPRKHPLPIRPKKEYVQHSSTNKGPAEASKEPPMMSIMLQQNHLLDALKSIQLNQTKVQEMMDILKSKDTSGGASTITSPQNVATPSQQTPVTKINMTETPVGVGQSLLTTPRSPYMQGANLRLPAHQVTPSQLTPLKIQPQQRGLKKVDNSTPVTVQMAHGHPLVPINVKNETGNVETMFLLNIPWSYIGTPPPPSIATPKQQRKSNGELMTVRELMDQGHDMAVLEGSSSMDPDSPSEVSTPKIPIEPRSIIPEEQEYIELTSEHVSENVRIFKSLDEMETSLLELFEETGTHFVHFMKETRFETPFDAAKAGKVRFVLGKNIDQKAPTIAFHGLALHYWGRKVLQCHQGSDKSLSHKLKRKAQAEIEDQESMNKGIPLKNRRHIGVITKKMGCPSKIYMTHFVRFLDFKIDAPTAFYKKHMSEQLRLCLKHHPEKVRYEELYAVTWPKLEDHSNHPVGMQPDAGGKERMDPRIVKKIEDLQRKGVCDNPKEMRKIIETYVLTELFPNDPLKQRLKKYRPSPSDVRNVMYRMKKKLSFCDKNQKQIEEAAYKLMENLPEDNFYLRLKANDEEKKTKSTFLFVYQSAWQKQLLQRYGKQVCVLDGVHRALRHSAYFYFLCVPTNSQYMVVGMFIVEMEDKSSIAEALEIFKSWNPEWSPLHFMVDLWHHEIDGVEQAFPETKVHMTEFHRDRTWVKWTGRKDNKVRKVERRILDMISKITLAVSETEVTEGVEELKNSDIWHHSVKLRKCCSSRWLPAVERWSQFYQSDLLKICLRVNNGSERQSDLLMYEALEQYKDYNLCQLMTVLISNCLPQSYKKYIEMNLQRSEYFIGQNMALEPFLHNRPKWFVDHINSRTSTGITRPNILVIGDGIFDVTNSSFGELHRVQFGEENTLPSCTCDDWWSHKMPCEHFIAIFQLVPGWNFDCLPHTYTDLPYFTTDDVAIQDRVIESEGPQPPPVYFDFLDVACEEVHVDHEGYIQKMISPETVEPPKVKITRPKVSKRDQLYGKCMETIKSIEGQLNNIQEETFLGNMHSKLSDLLAETKLQAFNDENAATCASEAGEGQKRKLDSSSDDTEGIPAKRPFIIAPEQEQTLIIESEPLS